MILFIDTSDFNNLRLALIENSNVKEMVRGVAFNENYKTNAFLESFLKKNRIAPQQLTKIIVCSGPGSFTGLRVGVSLAQALGFALQIPVAAITKSRVPKDLLKLRSIKTGKILSLHYGRKPNITTAKNQKNKKRV